MGGYGALLLLAGLAGLYLWNLSKAVENLQYLPGNITGFSLQGLSPTITAELIIQNTSNLSFTINSLVGSVTSNGTQIGNVADFTPVSVPANSQGVIPLTLTLLPVGIVNEIVSILSGNTGTRDILIHGSVNANGIQQAFDIPYKIGL